MMTRNEWIMLAVVWSVYDREIRLYKNGKLAFTMYTNDRLENPTKVFLSVKEETCKYIREALSLSFNDSLKSISLFIDFILFLYESIINSNASLTYGHFEIKKKYC